MVQSMVHESFSQWDLLVNTRSTVGLAGISHRGSFTAGQPFWNSARDICLVFAGECFGLNEVFAAEDEVDLTNAACLLTLYERLGVSFVEKLNGTFAGALADFRSGRVFLFNDRYGLGRIYYYQTADSFYFASEAKALLTVRPEVRRLDPAGLVEQLSCGCTLQNRTLFDGVSLLPGGALWMFDPGGSVSKSQYFDPSVWESQPPLTTDEYYPALRETFTRVLPRYFEGKQTIGMSLTGGLDGRMIMAYAPPANGKFPTYTFGGSYRDCFDVSIARRVAEVSRHPHQVFSVDVDFLRQFPVLAKKSVYLSDGTMDVGGAVEIYVNQQARAVAPIRLTGNYGSEILRRNIAFRPADDARAFLSPEFSALLEGAATTYGNERKCRALSFIAFKQVPWHHYARLSIEQSQLTVRSPYLDNDLIKLAYRAPEAWKTSSAAALRLVADASPELAGIPTDRGLLLSARGGMGRLLNAWRELTVRAEYAYDYGMPQWLALGDHHLRRLHLERLFLGRHKFYHFRIWYRDQLSPFVREVLLDPSSLSRPYLQRRAVEEIVQEHVSGRHNHTTKLHKLLSTELLHRELLEKF